jgi:hypothetical protein
MTTFPTDNTDNGDIMRSVTWQYADASKLVGALEILKEAFDQTTRDFFDSFVEKLNVSSADAFGLSVLGKCLGVPRVASISDENYKKLLIGRVKLLNSDATLEDYRKYVEDVFGGAVTVSDTLEMGLAYSIASGADEWISKLITDYPDAAFVFPSGVRSSTHSDSLMFGLDGQQNDTDVSVGGLDESGFNWRLTPEGNWQ